MQKVVITKQLHCITHESRFTQRTIKMHPFTLGELYLLL